MNIDSTLEDQKITLYPKQKEAIKFLFETQYALLLGQQGTGKTLCLTFLIKLWLASGFIKNVLIITKNEVLEKFKKSLLDFIPFLEEKDFNLFQDSDRAFFNRPGKVWICDYNQIKLAYYYLHPKQEVKKGRRKYFKDVFGLNKEWGLILDEIQAVKSVKSDIHKIIYKNSKKVLECIGSSGTPMEKVEEVFSIFRIIDRSILGDNYDYFMKSIAALGLNTYQVIYYLEKGVKKAWDKVNPRIFKMDRKDIVREVEKTIIDIPVKMGKYDFLEYQAKISQLKKKISIGRFVDTRLIATLIHPIFRYIKRVEENNTRFMTFWKLISRLIKSEKIIVWDNSPSIIKDLHSWFTERGVGSVYICGDIDKEERASIIEKFNKDESIRIFIVSYLTNSDAWEIPSRTDVRRMFYYSLPDRAINYSQSMDRIHRINSEEDILVYRLIMKDTIDEWAVELLDYKIKLMNGFISKEEFKEIERDSYLRFFGSGRKSIA